MRSHCLRIHLYIKKNNGFNSRITSEIHLGGKVKIDSIVGLKRWNRFSLPFKCSKLEIYDDDNECKHLTASLELTTKSIILYLLILDS